MSNQLFSGVQLNHRNNHTYITHEGYALSDYIPELPELIYQGDNSEYYNLNPGLYTIIINGTRYALMIHDALSGANRLIIRNIKDAFVLLGLHKHQVILYKLNTDPIIENFGYIMNHSVNDYLSLFIIDGITRQKTVNREVSMLYPCKLEFISMMNISIYSENRDGSSPSFKKDDYLFNMKNYLKGIDLGLRGKVCDTMYLDAAINRALFIFKTARLVLTGHEAYEKVPELSNESVSVFRYSNTLCKPGGLVISSHLPSIKWEQMIDRSYTS